MSFGCEGKTKMVVPVEVSKWPMMKGRMLGDRNVDKLHTKSGGVVFFFFCVCSTIGGVRKPCTDGEFHA